MNYRHQIEGRYFLVTILSLNMLAAPVIVSRIAWLFVLMTINVAGLGWCLWTRAPEKNPSYGWFYNWIASARQHPRLRHAIIALWIVILAEQMFIAIKHGHIDRSGWLMFCLGPIVLVRFIWPLPKNWQKANCRDVS